FLAFVEFNGDKMRTKIKSLIDEQMVEVSHSEQTNSWVGSLSWSDDGSMVVYLVTTPTSCQYFIRGFDGLSLKPPKLIHNCPQGSYGKIAFTHDNNRLVYTEAEKRNSPFTLFELNLKTGSKKRLNQPIHYLGGNSQFDIHPTENKLLISSPDKQQWEGFYSLDLETDELQLLFKQDAYICCGIWNHQGDRVVLMGEHPAYQLVSYNLRGKDRRVIYSGGQQIGAPERHSNGKDYLLTAGRVNMNTLYFNHQSQTVQLIANSSVDDRLARFSYQGNWVAYISLASGHEEIWLTDVDGNNTRKLTQFTDHRHYVDLIWSYDGAFLLGLALNEIHLINRQTGKASKLKLPQFEIRGVSLKDNQTVSFSSNIDNQWRVTHYDLKSEELSYLEERWSYVRYSEVASDSWWRDQSGQLYVGENQQLMDDPIINKIGPLLGRRFNLKKQANHWYWQVFNNGSYQLYSRVLTEPTEQLELENHSSSYDISSQGILYHQVESSNADIYTSVKE
ncbi:MAG: WD40 repeat domain-containing protein, partial [Kangiellaceae bacterium]|nr:WD40 repeat domain-containing protein [Kangiellaceae bacterium]